MVSFRDVFAVFSGLERSRGRFARPEGVRRRFFVILDVFSSIFLSFFRFFLLVFCRVLLFFCVLLERLRCAFAAHARRKTLIRATEEGVDQGMNQ